MVLVTEVRLTGGEGHHQYISEVRWVNPDTNETNVSTRQQMVDWIRNGGQALVRNGTRVIPVRVVEATPPYIQTFADGVWTDNLLALPRF